MYAHTFQVLQALPTTSGIIGEIILIALIAIVLWLIFNIGKSILKLVFGVIANSILGLISIFILDYVLKIGIPIKLYTLLIAALFGLPGVGTLVILRLFNVSLLAILLF